MHWAVHRPISVELIVERANAEKEHMGIGSGWEIYKIGCFDC